MIEYERNQCKYDLLFARRSSPHVELYIYNLILRSKIKTTKTRVQQKIMLHKPLHFVQTFNNDQSLF